MVPEHFFRRTPPDDFFWEYSMILVVVVAIQGSTDKYIYFSQCNNNSGRSARRLLGGNHMKEWEED